MPQVDNLTQAEIAAFEACQTYQECRDVCDNIKAARSGAYPPDWWDQMKLSGRMDRVYARWGGNSNLSMSVLKIIPKETP